MKQQPVVLVVEDEREIRRFVRTTLEEEGCRVVEAASVAEAIEAAAQENPALAVVDLGLPDRDGIQFILDLRRWSQAPVIVLSARSAEMDKIRALDNGADDYLTKPFGVGELRARVRAQLRRAAQAGRDDDAPQVSFGAVQVDLARRTVTVDAAPVHLTPTEFQLLAVLIANAGKVLTHRQLLKEVWGGAHAEESHYVRIYVANLRHKLEADPAQPRHLLTETGVGYRLVL